MDFPIWKQKRCEFLENIEEIEKNKRYIQKLENANLELLKEYKQKWKEEYKIC